MNSWTIEDLFLVSYLLLEPASLDPNMDLIQAGYFGLQSLIGSKLPESFDKFEVCLFNNLFNHWAEHKRRIILHYVEENRFLLISWLYGFIDKSSFL